MRKQLLAFLLSTAMLLGFVCLPVSAAEGGAPSAVTAGHWFYDQLTEQGQHIYDALESALEGGVLKTGTQSVSLDGVIGDTAAADYLKGNRSLFNDFSAAKDAFDLEHPEAWYFDSAQLTLTVEGSTTSARASMGVGKSADYYVPGVTDAAEAAAMTAALEAKVAAIADAARDAGGTYEAIKYVHDEVIRSIAYTYEIDCAPGSAGFIRTAYALVTGEGVCEGYVRSFQMILNELGIPCVPIHGTQTSGDPEAHMWCAVYISDDKGTGWYVVDPTWDDPIPDGNERDDYFMVGNDVTGSNWIPSGYVSTGAMCFSYPDISPRSYGAGQIASNGLTVIYDDALMEGTASTVYRVSYNGMGLYEASQKGYYFLTRMYDVNADGSVDAIDEWYYPVHMLLALGDSPDTFDPNGPLDNNGNQYYRDTAAYLVQSVSNCEYVEYAVTTTPPPAWQTPEDLISMGGFFSGSEDDIIAQTGLIYNPNGGYEQRPWVKNLTPAQTSTTYVGATHTIHMEFTDPLFHPDAASVAVSEALGKVNEARTAMSEHVGLDYTGTNYSWGVNGGLPHQFALKPEPQNVRWYCTTHGVHTSMSEIEAYGSACRLTTLEFEFTPSVMWADDSVAYEFYVTGLVGVKSNKKPEQAGMSLVFENESMYCAYRCVKRGGIDWNMWGQPMLLDDPNSLDFSKLVVEGIDGARESIEELYGSMNLDQYDMNGRLLLVVEDAGADRDKANTMSDLLEGTMGVDLQSAVASALYEIDFARVCGKTVVETGQSMRMQVGFPAGFDAGSLSTTVFKVYHFIKNSDGDIIGVEEIPVTVTPYGLVFDVRSFSPFAIVAEEAPYIDNSRSAVLVSDGHGTITSNYVLGDGEVAGTLVLNPEESYQITITPDPGYALESITAAGLTGGYEIRCENGTFTLSYDNIGSTNAMIGVTFAPVDEAPGTVDILSLCGHEHVTSLGGEAATCTEPGAAPTVLCDDCGQILSTGEPIQPTGHVYNIPADYKEPTCTAPGTALTCTVCGFVAQAPALGHDFLMGVCTRCDAREQYTVVFDPNGGRLVSGSETLTVNANSTLNAGSLPSATKDNAVFAGWYTSKILGDGEEFGSDRSVTRSIVLYAAWNDVTTETAGDGTVTSTVTDGKTGTVIVTVTRPDGSVSARVTVPEGVSPVTVTIPARVTAGTVAVDRVTGKLIMLSVPVADGVKVVLEGSADLILADRSVAFADMPAEHWAAAYVDFVTAHGLFYGMDDGFCPDTHMSRAMLMTVLARMSGVDTSSGIPWYAPGMKWAMEKGISDGSDPDDDITREQLATMLYRYIGSPQVEGGVPDFPDAGEISDWALDAMTWAVQNGIINGSDGYLLPTGPALRSEVAAMIERFCRNILVG